MVAYFSNDRSRRKQHTSTEVFSQKKRQTRTEVRARSLRWVILSIEHSHCIATMPLVLLGSIAAMSVFTRWAMRTSSSGVFALGKIRGWVRGVYQTTLFCGRRCAVVWERRRNIRKSHLLSKNLCSIARRFWSYYGYRKHYERVYSCQVIFSFYDGMAWIVVRIQFVTSGSKIFPQGEATAH